nr:MAG TPA: hypothetical protein [Caudoviricetes sp.]
MFLFSGTISLYSRFPKMSIPNFRFSGIFFLTFSKFKSII